MLPQEYQYLRDLDPNKSIHDPEKTPIQPQVLPSKRVRTARGRAAGRIAGILGLAIAGGAGAAATLSSAGCEPVDDNGAPTLNVGDAHSGDAFALGDGISSGNGEPPQKKTLAQKRLALMAEEMPWLSNVPNPVDLQKTTVDGWDVYMTTTASGELYYYSTPAGSNGFDGEAKPLSVPLFAAEETKIVNATVVLKNGQPFLLVRVKDIIRNGYFTAAGTISISGDSIIDAQDDDFQNPEDVIPDTHLPNSFGGPFENYQNQAGDTILFHLDSFNDRIVSWNVTTGEEKTGSSVTDTDRTMCEGPLPGNPMASGTDINGAEPGGDVVFTLNSGNNGCEINVDPLLSDGTTNESDPDVSTFRTAVNNYLAEQQTPYTNDDGVRVGRLVRSFLFDGSVKDRTGWIAIQIDHIDLDNGGEVLWEQMEMLNVSDLEFNPGTDTVESDEDAGDGGSRDDADVEGGDAQPATDEVSAPDEVHHPDEVSAPDETQPAPDEVSAPDEAQPGSDEVSPDPDVVESTDEGVSPETTPDTTPTDPVLAMFELVGGKDCKVTRLDNGGANTDTYRVQIKGQDCVVKIGNDATFTIETPDGVTGTFVCEGGKIRSVNGPICDGGPGKMSMERDGGDATVGGTNEFGTAILGGAGTKLFWEGLGDGLVDAEITETNDAWVSIYVAGSDEEIRVPVTPGEGFRINMKALNQGAAAVDTGEIPPPPDDGGSGSCACSGVDGGLNDRAAINPTDLTAFAILLLLGAAMMKRNQKARALALYEAAAKLRHRSEQHVGEVFADAWHNDMDRISGGMKASWEAVKGGVRTGLARVFGGV